MKMYDVDSFTDKKKTYKVRVDDDGIWRCNCLYFIRREKEIVVCKHILGTMINIKNDQTRKKDISVGESAEGVKS